MSSFIWENGTFVSFRDYLLSESIKPKEIKFGTNYNNFNDGKIVNINGIILTSFKFNERLYTVIIDNKNSVGFHWSEIPEKEIDYLDIITQNSSKNKILNSTSALKAFSYVFYIILVILKKHNKKEVLFSAEHTNLAKVYDSMVENKFFLKELEKAGYEYLGFIDKSYVFRRAR